MDSVSNRICARQCEYRSPSGYCGITAGCAYESYSTKTYVLVDDQTKKYTHSNSISITNDGKYHYLYVGNKLVMKDESIYNITREIEKHEKEHKL